MAMEESHRRVQWVYGSTTNQELEERYDQWATEYDRDLAEDFAWNAPDNGARVLASLVPADANVLDAGAGTGLAGICPRPAAGFTNMAAMDISQGMLDVAKEKNVYSSFHQMVMGDTLGFETDEFDAVISIGVFTLGHAPISSFDELVRVTKPRRLHSVQPPHRHGRGRLPGLLQQAGRGWSMEGGTDNRPLPAHAQGRAGGLPPDLGLPGELIKSKPVQRA